MDVHRQPGIMIIMGLSGTRCAVLEVPQENCSPRVPDLPQVARASETSIVRRRLSFGSSEAMNLERDASHRSCPPRRSRIARASPDR